MKNSQETLVMCCTSTILVKIKEKLFKWDKVMWVSLRVCSRIELLFEVACERFWRGLRGLTNGSKDSKVLWRIFYSSNWDENDIFSCMNLKKNKINKLIVNRLHSIDFQNFSNFNLNFFLQFTIYKSDNQW